MGLVPKETSVDVLSLNLEVTNAKCYDGAWDSRTQEVFKNQDFVLAKIREKEPEAHVTYFPVEELHVVHCWGREISSYTPTKGSALLDAYKKLFLSS